MPLQGLSPNSSNNHTIFQNSITNNATGELTTTQANQFTSENSKQLTVRTEKPKGLFIYYFLIKRTNDRSQKKGFNQKWNYE